MLETELSLSRGTYSPGQRHLLVARVGKMAGSITPGWSAAFIPSVIKNLETAFGEHQDRFSICWGSEAARIVEVK